MKIIYKNNNNKNIYKMYNNHKKINKIILAIQINRLKLKNKLIKNNYNKKNNKFKLII